MCWYFFPTLMNAVWTRQSKTKSLSGFPFLKASDCKTCCETKQLSKHQSWNLAALGLGGVCEQQCFWLHFWSLRGQVLNWGKVILLVELYWVNEFPYNHLNRATWSSNNASFSYYSNNQQRLNYQILDFNLPRKWGCSLHLLLTVLLVPNIRRWVNTFLKWDIIGLFLFVSNDFL